jgi:hypothetical protein
LARISGFTVAAETDAVTVAARAAPPAAVKQINAAEICAAMADGVRKLPSMPPEFSVAGELQPKWLNFCQP